MFVDNRKGFAMKKMMLVIIVFTMLASLVACSGTTPSTPTYQSYDQVYITPTLSPKPDWLVRWLNEPVCQPSCWENITPGKTSFMDAQAIASTISGAKVSYVDNDSISLKSNQYSEYYFALLQSRRDVNIQEIDLTTEYTSLELGEIVDRYGFPDEMIRFRSFDDSTTRWIDLLYYDLGMVISFKPLASQPWNKTSLNASIYISTISLYAPQLKYYFNAPQWLGMIVSPAINLKGYGIYNVPEGKLYP